MTDTNAERQARRRAKEKEWLKRHGFKSVAGLMGALMRGDYVILHNRGRGKLSGSSKSRG